MDDLPLARAVKASFLWAGSGALIISLCRWGLKMSVGLDDIAAAAMAGAIAALIPALCLPRGFTLPNDVTTVILRVISATCWWALAYGIVKGSIYQLPDRHRPTHANGWLSWGQEPGLFLISAFEWGVVGLMFISIPIYYYLKAVKETSSFSGPDAGPVRHINGPRSQFSTAQAIAIALIVLCALLVLFYIGLVLES